MESLLNKPIYKYNCTSRSQIICKSWVNCCFISSFQIQMKKLYEDFPDLNVLLDLLYKNTPNAFTHFAYDFPEKWFKLKEYLCSKNKIWSERLDQIILRICIPTSINNQCVLISFINLNVLIPDQIAQGNNDSLDKALSDEIGQNKKFVDIIQLHNHFEPINIISTEGVLKDIKDISDFETFFS